jgi:ATP-dependent RNA helicase DDX10/DBP4
MAEEGSHSSSALDIPARLHQLYVKLPIYDKMRILFSFLKFHKEQKIIVFVSTCAQSRFMFELFRHMRPGLPLLCLHGKQSQSKRTFIFQDFMDKTKGCLISTDISSRGLDFKNVHWILHFDCPESVEAYVHRVGRTARNRAEGTSLMFVSEDTKEENFVLTLEEEHGINVQLTTLSTQIDEKYRFGLFGRRTQALVQKFNNMEGKSSFVDMFVLALKAAKSFLKSYYYQNDKNVFDLRTLFDKDQPASDQEEKVKTMVRWLYSLGIQLGYNTVDVSVLYEEGEDEEEGASKYSNRNLFQYEEYGELLRKYMAVILK